MLSPHTTHLNQHQSPRLEDCNVVFLTMDSCRYDTAKAADIPTMSSIGPIRMGWTHGSYTVPAHTAFFTGHLPSVMDEPRLPYYTESTRQLWKISTGRHQERPERFGLLLEGNDIIEGYRKLGFDILGVGGVTQFAPGSQLREFFGDDFMYVGLPLDEEPLQERTPTLFPLQHVNTIVQKISKCEKWFLFINAPETHYPYDCGDGIPSDILEKFPILKQHLNLRQPQDPLHDAALGKALFDLQVKALESIDQRLQELLEKLPKQRPILFIACGDHGENFGEHFAGRPRWGHLFPSEQVLQVPVCIGFIQTTP